MKTTDEWEALLAAATPGPWRWHWDHGTMKLEGADTMPVATDLHVHDSDLLAAAPEAVAEVVRLHRALEERVRVCQKVAEKMDSNGDTDVGDVMRYTIRYLNIILEGHNND